MNREQRRKAEKIAAKKGVSFSPPVSVGAVLDKKNKAIRFVLSSKTNHFTMPYDNTRRLLAIVQGLLNEGEKDGE